MQYYELVAARMNSPLQHWASQLPKYARFGAWDDRAQYAGYAPSGHYFGGLYNLLRR